MRAIILAAGQGIRLGNGLSSVPKCLLKIGNETIIEKQVESLSEIGITQIFIVIGAKGECWSQSSYDRIRKISKNLIINFDNNITCNTVSASLALKNLKEDDTILLDGDVVYEKNLIRKMISTKHKNIIVAKEAVSMKEIGCRLIKSGNGDYKLKNLGKNIIGMDFPWYIYSGIIKISKSSYRYFHKNLCNTKFIAEELDAPLREFIKKDDIYILNTPAKDWVNINTQEDLKKAIELFSI